MGDIAFARALHILAVVHWIGGVSMVTLVILPAIKHLAEPARRHALFETVEGHFSRQAKFSVTLAGLSGFYMTHRLDAWYRFLDPAFWWMHAMVLIWLLFSFILFIAEPMLIHKSLRYRAGTDRLEVMHLIQYSHWLLLFISAITVVAAVLGAHGVFI